jgi:hypothetical protein
MNFRRCDVNLKTGLWIGFWLYILQTGSPSALTAIIQLIGRL